MIIDDMIIDHVLFREVYITIWRKSSILYWKWNWPQILRFQITPRMQVDLWRWRSMANNILSATASFAREHIDYFCLLNILPLLIIERYYVKLCKFRQTPLNVVEKEKDDWQTLLRKVGPSCLLSSWKSFNFVDSWEKLCIQVIILTRIFSSLSFQRSPCLWKIKIAQLRHTHLETFLDKEMGHF